MLQSRGSSEGQDGQKSRGKVSVLIPSYGHAAYIRQTIESILGQTRPVDEIIVINDGSPDDTNSAVAPYLDKITYVEQENRGLTQTLNRGIAMCTGDYIALSASDDWLAPDTIEVLAGIMDDHPDVGLVHGNMTVVDEQGNPSPYFNWHNWQRVAPYPIGKHRQTVALIQRNCIPGQANLCRREALLQAGPYPTHPFLQDWGMWLTIALNGWYLYGEPRSLAYYRRHGNNLSRPSMMEEALLDIVDGMIELERKFTGHLSPEERLAFRATKHSTLRKLGWLYLAQRDRGLAQDIFWRLTLNSRDPRASIGLVATLLPLRLFEWLLKMRDTRLVFQFERLLS